MRYTHEYQALQEQLHARGDYGISGQKHADKIIELSKRLGTKDVLDYGCGKSTLAKSLPFYIQQYDPFIPAYAAEPNPADLVVCSDVLEHIEPACLGDVLEHIYSKTMKALFIDVATRPAQKVLADGRNAHLIQEKPLWWLNRLAIWFDPQSMVTYQGGFIAVCVPIPNPVPTSK